MKDSPAIRVLIGYAVIAGFASFLLFTNLGGRLLWCDEAETANLAVNVTKYGIPMAFDGKNHLRLGFEGNSPVWLWSPWLQEYLAAASFLLFGVGTVTARLPFVIVALAAVLLLIRLTYRLVSDHWIALLSGILLVCSEVFVLHARQCRYYSLIVLGQILLMYSVNRLFKKQDKRSGLYLGAALALLFYSNYMFVVGNVLALIFLLPFLVRRHRQAVSPLVLGLVVFVVLAAPWLFYAHPWHQTELIGREDLLPKMMWYLSEIHFHFVPLILFLIPAAYGARRLMPGALFRRDGTRANRGLSAGNFRADSETPEHRPPVGPANDKRRGLYCFLWILIPLHLLFISLAIGSFLRYLLSLIPVLILLLVTHLDRYLKPRFLIFPLVAILCLSNAISVLSAYPFKRDHPLRLPLVNLIRGVRTPYTDRLTDVLGFLSRNGRPDQSVLVFDPEFPLIFYTGMKIIDGRLLADKFPKELPDWIFSVSASGVFADPVVKPPPDVAGSYESILLNVHDSSRRGSIPEPDLYESFTSPRMTEMVIYRRKQATPSN